MKREISSRQLITSEELQAWLTAKLKQIEDCEECSVGGILLLQQPDAFGCNWSDSVVLSSGGVPVDYVWPHMTRIIAEARLRFNLRESVQNRAF